jgi:hypothetical protein
MNESQNIGDEKELVRGWNYTQTFCALAVAFVLQDIAFDSLSINDESKFHLALALDGLVLLRTAIARGTNETGRGWLFYAILLYTSVLWIEGAFWVRVRLG